MKQLCYEVLIDIAKKMIIRGQILYQYAVEELLKEKLKGG